VRLRAAIVLAVLAAVVIAAPARAEDVAGQDQLVASPTFRVAYVARVIHATFAKERPWGRNKQQLGVRAPWGGGITQLLVLESAQVVRSPAHPEDQRLWLRVALPRRPNGTSGWVPADHVQVSRTLWRVHISTLKRLVQVFHDGVLARSFRAVVGAPATPTPHGEFAISEPIKQSDPRGFLGPWALHLTAFSNVLDNYGGGPGRVAIHGRDGASLSDPLGTARSHGCIRVENKDIRFLARVAPPGTPVIIGSPALRLTRGGRPLAGQGG
jgi:hypothetical protein